MNSTGRFLLLLGAIAGGLLGAAMVRADDVTVLRELQYRPGSKACTLDLAMPKEVGAAAPRPAIVVIHGGGWIEGDKSSFSTTDKRAPANILDFANSGFVAATINYRLAREAAFPAALDDCRCAVRWLRAHAAEYHVDVDHIGVWGNSAGGHLALLLAMMPPPDKLDPAEPYADQSSAVQSAASDSGPIDLVAGHEQNQLRSVIEMFLGGPLDASRRSAYERASPSTYAGSTAGGSAAVARNSAPPVPPKFPPLLLIYGVSDGQVNVTTADAFVAALGRAGHKDVSYFRLAGVDHCPHSLARIPYLQPIVVEFFQRTLRPGK